MYDIVIIGAGASGLIAASMIKNQKVCVIEKNPKVGSKIKISGGGKCNITNKYLDEKFYLGDKEFIKNSFLEFSNNDLLSFLNSHKVFPKLDEKIVKGTYFCNASEDVVDLFLKLTKHCHFYLNTQVEDVEYKNEIFIIKTNKEQIKSKKLIIASGGLSYPILGATDIGYKIALKFGHTINKLNPALVGFTVQKEQFWFKELSGLSLKDIEVTIGDKKLIGDFLFTHKGCSGPVVLSSSLYWKKGNISINFLPKKESYLPKRFKQAIKNKEIDLNNYIFSPAGNFGYTKSEVTKGGVSIDEIDNNFESKFQKNLFFIGEVLDVTGELGGYNLQWAFSSGFVCGKKIL